MSENARKTPQYDKSKTAKQGAAQPPSTAGTANPGESAGSNTPAPSTERFLMVNVCPEATAEQIVEAVEKALSTIDIPFFQYVTPSKVQEAEIRALSSRMAPGQGLLMLVRQEGW